MSGIFTPAAERPMLFVPLGEGAIAPFGLSPRMRAWRVASSMGLEPAGDEALRDEGSRSILIQDVGHVISPGWLAYMIARPGTLLTCKGLPVLAHATRPAERIEAQRLFAEGTASDSAVLEIVAAEDIDLDAVDQHHRPFIAPLDDRADIDAIERALFAAATPRVADIVSRTVLRPPAFHLTRTAARLGLTANKVTGIAALFALVAFVFFWQGWYAGGILCAILFALADTIDGKLAKITGTSNPWGRRLDAILDLVHPPLWYVAWMRGIETGTQRLEPVYALMLTIVIVTAYVGIRIIEGVFRRDYGFALHLWRPFDSRFHAIAAQRNINILLLAASLVVMHPEWGIQWVAAWSLVTLTVLGVRLAAAQGGTLRGDIPASWLLPDQDIEEEAA